MAGFFSAALSASACPLGGGCPHKRFYEKVVKVKADVAVLLE
jgi:hypothetical protein